MWLPNDVAFALKELHQKRHARSPIERKEIMSLVRGGMLALSPGGYRSACPHAITGPPDVARREKLGKAARIGALGTSLSEPCTMHTYFESFGGAPTLAGHEQRLISSWREAWEANGWKTRVISENDARGHPEYESLSDAFMALPTVGRSTLLLKPKLPVLFARSHASAFALIGT
jgi:hypothetical protein